MNQVIEKRPPVKDREASTKTIKILYIEDNIANQKLVQRVLSREKYSLVLANDGLTGLNMAMEERPDLILMDINLPDMNGKDITASLKAKPAFQNVPIIALTADASNENRNRSLAVGCEGFITKPIDIVSFPKKIASFLAGNKESLPTERQQETLKSYVGELVTNLEAKVKELEAANLKLRKLDQAKSNFIQLVSHELRTPLTLINGYKMMLSSITVAGPDQRKKLDDVKSGLDKGIQRLSSVIQEVLNVSKITSSSLTLVKGSVNLTYIIEPIIRGFERSCVERSISILLEDMSHLPMIQADGEQLGLAFENVLGNSIKFTPDGGTIRIYPLQMEGSITIAFKDQGVGIDSQEQKSIFDPFYTVEAIENHSTSKTQFLGGGMGLGLPIAKGIIEAHNGRIWVESPGRNPNTLPGSIFYILLPAD